MNHRTERAKYGYGLAPDQYDAMEAEWHAHFAADRGISGFCRYVHAQYTTLGIRRRPDFSYNKNATDKASH